MPGQFLLKDVVLLGAAVCSLGEALAAPSRIIKRYKRARLRLGLSNGKGGMK